MTRVTLGRLSGIVSLALALVATSSCGEVARTGRSPAYLILNSLVADGGGNTLSSDVQMIDDDGNAFFDHDLAVATFSAGLKDPGAIGSPTAPSPLNQLTVTGYRVEFTRTDGRNTPGVDVPFGFDGAATTVVPGEVTFVIVTHAMKLEPPLRNLRGFGGQMFIHTIAKVTFYGRDQAGNDVSVTGSLSVNFGDFHDE